MDKADIEPLYSTLFFVKFSALNVAISLSEWTPRAYIRDAISNVITKYLTDDVEWVCYVTA